MKWALVIWLSIPDNYTIYDQFKTLSECLDKQQQVSRALKQANSEMMVNCREIKNQKVSFLIDIAD